MATSNWKIIPQFENENRKLSFARKRQSRAITSTETLHAIGTHFQRGFADDAAALYLDTCFASTVLLMTAIDQILPRIFRSSLTPPRRITLGIPK